MLSGVEKVGFYNLNWLLVSAMRSVLLFHAAKSFRFGDWHVLDAPRNLASTLHLSFFSQWMMPLCFVMSGASTTSAFQHQSAGESIRERSLQILLPLVVFG